MNRYPTIGIRPIVDARRLGIRDALEEKTREMAEKAKEIIEQNVRYADGKPVKVVIYSGSIGGGEEAARCEEAFVQQNVCATLSVTPSWCYPLETIDTNPLTIKAIWGFNGTQRPGAVYLAAALSAHNQMGLPAFAIYGKNVQDMEDQEIPTDVRKKIIRFASCAIAVGQLRNKAYINIGSVSMGIMGSYMDPLFYLKYFGIRPEWVDMTEILRREALEIYDIEEYEKALFWVRQNCREGWDKNAEEVQHTREEKDKEWEFVVKLTLIIRDIMIGNDKLSDWGWKEEALGKNAIAAGFQGQRSWTDWKPNGDFTESIMNSSFDWRGNKQPLILATENDGLNGISMLLANLLTGKAIGFSDIRCYWSPEAIERVTGWVPDEFASEGFIHLINSGSTCLDATGKSRDEKGTAVMKAWWDMTERDMRDCLAATDWCPAELCQFRGGGYSSHFVTDAQMPLTLIRMNLTDGVGPTLQIAEGCSVILPEKVHEKLNMRTDPTWPTTWFVPRLNGVGPFKDVYAVMANWGANHGAFVHGHIGAELITLASMLRIPVSMHNLSSDDIFRPQAWASFGTDNQQAADYKACDYYGPIYK